MMLLLSVVMAIPAKSQLSSPEYTHFGSWSMTYPTVENVNFRLNDGSVFQGKKSTLAISGQPTQVTYYGTITKPSGERWVSAEVNFGFDANLNPMSVVWYITPNGEVYRQEYRNGQCVSSTPETRNYTLNGPYLAIQAETYGGGGYYNGGSTGGSYDSGSSSGNSNYNRHEATCGGCGGTGKCSLCGGKGYKDGQTFYNGRYQCSRCHGTGTCQTCGGVGKKYGNY